MSPLPRGEHALHPLLVALVLLILVVKPLVELDLLPVFAMAIGLQAVILTGLFCLDEAPNRTRHLAFVAVLTSVGLQGLALGSAGGTPGLFAAGAAALAISVLIGAILRQIFAPGRITFRRIEGAIAAYLLIGLVFACFYDLLHGLVPAAFLHHGEPARAAEQVGSYLFFSFITLTTTGYGDIVPVHPVARSLAILEALTGQLYLAILLARLVSLQISSRP
ncbi:MAG: potassium channel family protein [Roseococcus sp.]